MHERAPHLVLVGMMGSGKSTIGKRVAKRLDRPFVDLDDAVEQRAGATVAEIFERDGEAAFRAAESRELSNALASPQPSVIATGGGAVLAAQNRAAITSGAFTVWLRAEPTVLSGRVRGGNERPLLRGGSTARTMAALLTEREPLYREVADEIVDVDTMSRERVVNRVVAALTDASRSGAGS